VRRLLIALSLIVLGSACTQQQGRRPDLGAHALYDQVRDLSARGDHVGASKLTDLLRREHTHSVFGVLATLDRYRVGTDVIEAARVGTLGASRFPAAVDLCAP